MLGFKPLTRIIHEKVGFSSFLGNTALLSWETGVAPGFARIIAGNLDFYSPE
jgi:hypothetical protein